MYVDESNRTWYGGMRHQKHLTRDSLKRRIRPGSQTCTGRANVRVNDPFAVGIEELKRPFWPLPCRRGLSLNQTRRRKSK